MVQITYDRVKPSGAMSALAMWRSATGPMAAKALETTARSVKTLRYEVKTIEVSECDNEIHGGTVTSLLTIYKNRWVSLYETS
jgi:hypothetical protein